MFFLKNRTLDDIDFCIKNGLLFYKNFLVKSLEKLSTGMRINRAQDDAAGLAMSEQMRGQIRGLGKAKQNAQDGIAALQIAEGGMAEITNIMQRQRELAIQAANDTLTSTERKYLNDEFKHLTDEVNRIAATVEYNSINMLKDFGNASRGTLHVGANSTLSMTENAIKIEYSITIVGSIKNLNEQQNAEEAIKDLEVMLKSISGLRASIGSYINRLEFTINNIANLEFNTQDAESRIRDTNFAFETTQFTRNQIMVQSATNMLSQANTLPQSVLALIG